MQILTFIRDLNQRGITLSSQGNNALKISRASALSDAEMEILREIKPEVLTLLEKQPLPHLPITRSDVEAAHPEIVALENGQKVLLSDALNHAMDADGDDPGDWPDLLNLDCLLAFADTLLLDGLIQPVTDPMPVSDDPLALLDDLALLPEDWSYIKAHLSRYPKRCHKAILSEYRKRWLDAVAQVALPHQQDNAGRHAANAWLRTRNMPQ